jgi:hypothetical protein
MDGQNRTDASHGAVEEAYPIGPNITIADTSLLYRGGGLAGDVNIGTRPSWGWFLRHANGVTFDRLHLHSSIVQTAAHL